MSDLVKCVKCGWVHFQVTAEYVRKWQELWNKFWPTLDAEGRKAYGLSDGPPGPDLYLSCFRCGNDYKNFVEAKSEDVPLGSTIQPILAQNETLNIS